MTNIGHRRDDIDALNNHHRKNYHHTHTIILHSRLIIIPIVVSSSNYISHIHAYHTVADMPLMTPTDETQSSNQIQRNHIDAIVGEGGRTTITQ